MLHSRPISKAEKEIENSRRSSPIKHVSKPPRERPSTAPPKPKPAAVHVSSTYASLYIYDKMPLSFIGLHPESCGELSSYPNLIRNSYPPWYPLYCCWVFSSISVKSNWFSQSFYSMLFLLHFYVGKLLCQFLMHNQTRISFISQATEALDIFQVICLGILKLHFDLYMLPIAVCFYFFH